jgi:hypothetical protein
LADFDRETELFCRLPSGTLKIVFQLELLSGRASSWLREPDNLRTFVSSPLADLLPVSSIWTGEEKAPCPFYPPGAPALAHCVTTGATPFRLNLHVRDVGNAIMFGPIGMGKSTHLGFHRGAIAPVSRDDAVLLR